MPYRRASKTSYKTRLKRPRGRTQQKTKQNPKNVTALKSSKRRQKKIWLEKIKTRKWGEVEYPKGTKPLVVEVKMDGSTQILKSGIGYKKDTDLKAIQKVLEEKAKRELTQDKKAEIRVHFLGSWRKPISFHVIGTQPPRPPIIGQPGWMEEISSNEALRKDIEKELANPKRKTASDVEAMAYLMTASTAGPMSEHWARIYFHLAGKYLRKKQGKKKLPKPMGFLNQKLGDYEKAQLQDLKDWIFRQQQKELAERRKRAKILSEESRASEGSIKSLTYGTYLCLK